MQDEILALSCLLQRFGPRLGRPRVDTLNGSRHANLKESEKRFYRSLIQKADERFDAHLARLQQEGE